MQQDLMNEPENSKPGSWGAGEMFDSVPPFQNAHVTPRLHLAQQFTPVHLLFYPVRPTMSQTKHSLLENIRKENSAAGVIPIPALSFLPSHITHSRRRCILCGLE